MPSVPISRRGWIVLAVVVLVVGVAIWGIRAGYAPQIGRFFASEPGYVPSCAWHGEQLSPYAPQCCAGFVPVSVKRELRPLPTREPLETIADVASDASSDVEATPMATAIEESALRLPEPVEYCVMPGCEAVARVVQCVRAPCEPIIDIVCPDGVVPPPRPTYTPPQSIVIFPVLTYDSVAPGGMYVIQLFGEFGNLPVTTAEMHLSFEGGEIIGYDPGPELSKVIEILQPSTGNWGITVGIPPGDDGVRNYVSLGRLTVHVSDQLQPGADYITISVLPTTRVAYEGSIEAVYSSEQRLSLYVLNTPPSPSVLPPGDLPSLIADSTRVVGSQSPGGDFDVPITLNTGGLAVTAVKVVAEVDGAEIYMVGLNTADFPEVLADPVGIGSNHVAFTVGSGTGGGVTASSIDVGTISIKVPANAVVGSQVNLYILSAGSEVSADGYPDNVLQFAGNAGFVLAEATSKPGDADGDGDVDIFDYNIVVSNFNSSGPAGDLDADGDVDIFDYNIVVSNFGS